MSNSSFQRLFNRRPTTATVGLSIAAISFFATILQGLIALLSSVNRFFFDFTSGIELGDTGITFRQALIGCTWALIGLIACYRALEPRNLARFTVLITSGVKLFAFLAFSTQVNMPLWQYLLTLILAAAPIVLLLLPPSNQYYGRNQ
ncbi:MAG: hypothetical protein RL589_225 [Actinomycetota bacterium]|jgi:hypothetical protein